MHRHDRFRSHWTLALVLAASAVAAPAWAQTEGGSSEQPAKPDNPGHISVNGNAVTLVRPEAMRVAFMISGRAEEVADALLKFREQRKRVVEALAANGIEEKSIVETGMAVGSNTDAQQMMVWNGQEGDTPTPEFEVSVAMRLDLPWPAEESSDAIAERLGKLIEVLSEAGVPLGPTVQQARMGMQSGGIAVQPVPANLSQVRKDSTRQAMEEARRLAEALAEHTGRKLGRIIAVDDVGSYNQNRAQVQWGPWGQPQNWAESFEYTAQVRVTYEIR